MALARWQINNLAIGQKFFHPALGEVLIVSFNETKTLAEVSVPSRHETDINGDCSRWIKPVHVADLH